MNKQQMNINRKLRNRQLVLCVWTCVLVVVILYWMHVIKWYLSAVDFYDRIKSTNMPWYSAKGTVF